MAVAKPFMVKVALPLPLTAVRPLVCATLKLPEFAFSTTVKLSPCASLTSKALPLAVLKTSARSSLRVCAEGRLASGAVLTCTPLTATADATSTLAVAEEKRA